MGRGLGKLQKKILDVIKNGCANSTYVDFINHKRLEFHGWTDVHELMYYVVNGLNCFRKDDKNDDEFYDPNFELKEPTEKDKQSIWRAIRNLERHGLIESKLFPIHWEERADKHSFLQHPHSWGNYDVKRGCANKQKAIRLAQRSTPMN